MAETRVVILSGPSGAGKSTAIKTLEDLGFFCVDNLPIILLPKFIELSQGSVEEIKKIAVVMDIRERPFLKEYPRIFGELRERGQKIELIYLEASDEAILRRFSETRRQHPLAEEGSVSEGITTEREELADLKQLADQIIDTTHLNVHQLREVITQYFSHLSPEKKMFITLLSFGYKFGVPYNVDIVIDVRFLPNPYFVEGLTYLTGNDQSVIDYVMRSEDTQQFIEKFKGFLDFLLPRYEKEGKTYLTIGIGCTGGKHRSVVIANHLDRIIDRERYTIRVDHQDLNKV
jgi:UPF0042 nucleotide-binding protein